jgi:hypothetical protein
MAGSSSLVLTLRALHAAVYAIAATASSPRAAGLLAVIRIMILMIRAPIANRIMLNFRHLLGTDCRWNRYICGLLVPGLHASVLSWLIQIVLLSVSRSAGDWLYPAGTFWTWRVIHAALVAATPF